MSDPIGIGSRVRFTIAPMRPGDNYVPTFGRVVEVVRLSATEVRFMVQETEYCGMIFDLDPRNVQAAPL